MAREVAQANLVLLLGLGMDGWVEKLARAEKKPKSVVVSSGLAQRKMGSTALANHSEEPSDPNEIDPHVWMDPLLAVRLAETIGRELALLARSSAESNTLHQRTQAVIADLQRLHQEFESQLQDVPRRQVVTFHGAYGYLFDRYHLETVGVIETFPGTEPSAAYLKDLVKLMRQTGLKTIFAEPQLPDRPAQVIAQEIGGTVERLDPCETILPEASQWSYQQRQRQNLATLKRVLSTPNSP
jgi:zinc transport system substrate-binding protein